MLLDFLGSEKREDLVDLLLAGREANGQGDLFGAGGGRESVDVLLDRIFSLVLDQRPLYFRWTQDVDGKQRHLSVPKKPLRQLIQDYLLPLVKGTKTHENCHGGEEGWSPERSLNGHLPCGSVLSFDLENAFPSFSEGQVRDFYSEVLRPFQIRYEPEMVDFLTEISTVQYGVSRGLPVGSTFSMALFNRALFRLDERLTQNSAQRGLTYSRWVDDITISSREPKNQEAFLGAVKLVNGGHPVSRTKIFFQGDGRDIYLLGYRITPEGRIFKNSREEREERKSSALDYNAIFGKSNYEVWD